MNNTTILLTGKEVQDQLQISRVTLYNWVKAGKLRQVRLTERSVRYNQKDIEMLIKKAG